MSRPETICHILSKWAASPDQDQKILYLGSNNKVEAELTYAEFWQRAVQTAAALKQVARPGARALVFVQPGIESLIAMIACFLAGVVAVPIGAPLTPANLLRLKSVVGDCKPQVILADAVQHPWRFRLMIARSCPSLLTAKWIAVAHVPQGVPTNAPLDLPSPETPAYLQYTSGSTGQPKGLIISHGNLMANMAIGDELIEHLAYKRFLNWMPLYHDYGLVCSLYALYRGGTAIQMSALGVIKAPSLWLQAISAYRIQFSGGPPFIYERCIDRMTDAQIDHLDLSHWTTALSGGGKLFPVTVQRFSERLAPAGFQQSYFAPCFGLAESTLGVTGTRVSRPVRMAFMNHDGTRGSFDHKAVKDPIASVGCGQTFIGHQVVIIDPLALKRLEDGQVGEICIAGPSVSAGYWRRAFSSPDEVVNLPGSGAMLRTGDLGFLLEGELFYAGRRKEMIKLMGRNIYPDDVEQTVNQAHKGLRRGCCAVFSDASNIHESVTLVAEVNNRGQRVAPQTIITAILTSLARNHQFTPQSIYLLKARTVPKTSSGKVRRLACQEMLAKGNLKSNIIHAWHTESGHEPFSTVRNRL